MKRGSTVILKSAIALIGLVFVALCAYVVPLGIITDGVGYYRPIFFGLYIPAIPFFYALFQAVKILNLIDKNKAFSKPSIRAFRNIKYCAGLISGLFIAGLPYIYYAANRDDAPGVILIALVIIGTSFIIATAAGVFQRLVQNAVDIKSENDLTV